MTITFFDSSMAQRFSPKPMLVLARVILKPLGEVTDVNHGSHIYQHVGSYVELLAENGSVINSAPYSWLEDYAPWPGTEFGWFVSSAVDAYRIAGSGIHIAAGNTAHGGSYGHHYADIGEWVVRYRSGCIKVLTDYDFTDRYDLNSARPLP